MYLSDLTLIVFLDKPLCFLVVWGFQSRYTQKIFRSSVGNHELCGVRKRLL